MEVTIAPGPDLTEKTQVNVGLAHVVDSNVGSLAWVRFHGRPASKTALGQALGETGASRENLPAPAIMATPLSFIKKMLQKRI